MPKLTVAPFLLIDSLFKGAAPNVRIVGASFDYEQGNVILEIEGEELPRCEQVAAVMTVTPPQVEFRPVPDVLQIMLPDGDAGQEFLDLMKNHGLKPRLIGDA